MVELKENRFTNNSDEFIKKLNLSKKVEDEDLKKECLKNIQNITAETEFFVNGELANSQAFMYLVSFFTDK